MKYADYSSKQAFIEAAQKLRNGYQALLEHLDNVDAVADQFAGKVLNKRFFDAITERAPKYKRAGNPQEVPTIVATRPTERYEGWALGFYMNSYSAPEELKHEYLYLKDESSARSQGTDETGRVVPEFWHVATAEKREYYRAMIYRLEDAIRGYDDYAGSLKALEDELAKRERELNPIFRKSNYGIPSGLWLKDRDGELGGYFAREKAATLQA